MESFYRYYFLGKMINLNFDKSWKKTSQKGLTCMKTHGFQAKCTWSWPFSWHSSSYSSHTWHICASFNEKQYCRKEFLTFSYKKLIFHFFCFLFFSLKWASTGGSILKPPVLALAHYRRFLRITAGSTQCRRLSSRTAGSVATSG